MSILKQLLKLTVPLSFYRSARRLIKQTKRTTNRIQKKLAIPTNPSFDLSAPILVMARGHSGTRMLAQLLEMAGVYMGHINDPQNLNATYDSVPWTYAFQKPLVSKLFKYGAGYSVAGHKAEIFAAAFRCLHQHLIYYQGGRWGFKTCAGMFAHPLYRFIFPNAKYIYMVRDGRDAIFSERGRFHLTSKVPYRDTYWDYYKIITFGISNDMNDTPFIFTDSPDDYDTLLQNKYWIQAKSWREHIHMVDYWRENKTLAPFVFTIYYEELCQDPIPVLTKLFDFLELRLTDSVRRFAQRNLHTISIGRWQNYERYVFNSCEDIGKIFADMEPELKQLGYPV